MRFSECQPHSCFDSYRMAPAVARLSSTISNHSIRHFTIQERNTQLVDTVAKTGN